jgi:hypothetical protein
MNRVNPRFHSRTFLRLFEFISVFTSIPFVSAINNQCLKLILGVQQLRRNKRLKPEQSAPVIAGFTTS